MEKVLTGRGLSRAIVATTELESMPPLRKAPRGTSLTRCSRTDSSSSARKPSTHSASLLVQVDDDLGVRARVDRVSPALQIPAELLEVVDLAVEDGPDRPVFVVHGLAAGLQVDDAQPSHAEPDAGRHVEALVVGAAV